MKSIGSLPIFLNIFSLAHSFASHASTGAPIAAFTIRSTTVTRASYTYESGAGIGPAAINFSPPHEQSSGPSHTQVNGFTIN